MKMGIVSPFIVFKNQKRPFEMPSEWRILTMITDENEARVFSVQSMVDRAMRKPIDSPVLTECLSHSNTVAVIIEDMTRSSPKREVLLRLLDELNAAHIKEQNISIIIGLGTHRAMKPDDIDKLYGQDLTTRFAVFNHDCRSPDMVKIGNLGSGTAVRINRKVHESSFKIGIGSIVPHPLSGFGGGGKIIFPGVVDFDSVLDHHLRLSFHPGTGLGKLKANLFYEEVQTMAQASGLNFIINCILDQRAQVRDVVAGDPISAHLEGIMRSQQAISRKFKGKSDITITTAYPHIEGSQIIKAIAPATRVTHEGGCIILVAECRGGIPDYVLKSFARFHERYGRNLINGVQSYFERRRLIMREGAIDFNMAMAFTLAALQRFRIILVSPDISRVEGEKMGFIHAENLDAAFDMASSFYPSPTVNIIPLGGIILPIF